MLTIMVANNPKRGRPEADEKAESFLYIRVRQSDKARWVKQAQSQGMKLSAWVVSRLNADM